MPNGRIEILKVPYFVLQEAAKDLKCKIACVAMFRESFGQI